MQKTKMSWNKKKYIKNRPEKVNNLKSKAINFIANLTIKVITVSKKIESRYAKAKRITEFFFGHVGRQERKKTHKNLCKNVRLSKCEKLL